MTPPLFSLVLLRFASQIVYPQDRADWVAEWKGELWAVSAARRTAVLSFVLGSFHDAWHLRCRSVRVQSTRMQSPEACLVLLACFIGLAAVIFPRVFNNAPRANPHPNLVFAATVALSVVILNCVWSWELAVPEGASSVGPLCTRWYLFLLAKFGAVPRYGLSSNSSSRHARTSSPGCYCRLHGRVPLDSTRTTAAVPGMSPSLGSACPHWNVRPDFPWMERH